MRGDMTLTELVYDQLGDLLVGYLFLFLLCAKKKELKLFTFLSPQMSN